MDIVGSKIYRVSIHCNIPDKHDAHASQPLVSFKIDQMETCQLASPEEIEFEINNICRELQSAGRKAKKLLIDKEKQIMHGVRRRQDSGMDSMEHKKSKA